ncbi:MAG: hypothetical protein HC836_33310 [Richelia sp. RM2_1_2]|nr:hypothetical protein [Richelia sp. RM2_1_2]
MIEKAINSNPEVFSVLSQYPKWLSMIVEAIDKPILAQTYCPEIIEIFDQYGLLAGKVHGFYAYECTRKTEQKSDFNAWLIDGELVVFYIESELVINRLEAITIEGESR